ncbi:hypothetical protein FQR65_LT03480 [Abscondita terminalis]|nr:hypothetical protein FQR65_LT03480 [Abscondita terminalis]
MFIRRVRALELCNSNVFGDVVVIRQSLPMLSQSKLTPLPNLLATTFKDDGKSDDDSLTEGKKHTNEQRRASKLIDELLLDIYHRSKSMSFSGYTSTTSLKSQRSVTKYSSSDLGKLSVLELLTVIQQLEDHVVRTSCALVRKLKRRDALRRQREAHCDVISSHLHKHATPESNMRFSIGPGPGDSGFSQWHSAMRMVAQLAEGIPPEFRRTLWMNLAERHLSSRNVNWLKVERECFSEWSHPADSELGVQIVKDLHRTGCSLFCGVDGQENQALLKRVLLAYARWNKSVGYCQGFNMLAALILQVTEKCETDALKLMIFLIEGVLPESYFADSLRGLSVDMAVFRELLKTRLPRLSRHLDALQTAAKDGTTSYEPPLTNVFTMQWFLTLFCNCLPQPTVLRVWDLILLEGNEVLLRTALGIWQVLAERILSVRSADEFYCIMGVLTREILEFGIIDANALIKAIVRIGPLTELPALREKYLYNINPWSTNVSSTVEAEVRNKQLKLYGREKLALDISALKKQYSKLKQRQRQAHIIFSAAVARQPSPASPVVAMNHLLLGKSALITSKRLGPPKGAIPPTRQTSQPTTLHWKDAPRQQSSSSSSSDTELCDDPDVPEDYSLTPTSKSPINSQLLPDNLNECVSDNLNLMKFDNTKQRSVLLSDETNVKYNSDSDISIDIGKTVDDSEVDNNVQNVDNSDIFDTQSSTKASEIMFDFGKYNIQSDSDDDSFEFERFLENRVRCFKQTSVDEESVASSSEDSSEIKRAGHVRKNSQRALEIIQENSLILHRILQCQNRLTPSPPVTTEDNSSKATVTQLNFRLPEGDEKETDIGMSDASNSIRFKGTDANAYESDDVVTQSIQYSSDDNNILMNSTYANNLTSDAAQDLVFKSETDFHTDNDYFSTYDYYAKEDLPKIEMDYKYLFDKSEYPCEDQNVYANIKDEFTYSNTEENEQVSSSYGDVELQSVDYESEIRPNFTDILDSEYTKTLEEKYENLILKSNRPSFLEVAANLGSGDSSCSSFNNSRMSSPINITDSTILNVNKKSPESSTQKSPVEVLKSPTTGRIYNPFPVNISSRQNKDVPLRLGLYKKS